MKVSATLAAGALALGVEAKNYLGFNSGATLANRAAKFKADFQAEFETAQNLKSAPGDFSAVRLYTNIQAYSEDDPIEAFEAAIDTKTEILLGVWTSGTDNIDKEISALKKAVDKYGSKLTDLVIGVSNKGGVGVQPDVLVDFINDFKKAFKGTPIGKIPVGHVDTWDVWGNATNKAVLDAIDFIGVDEYPYYENDKGNSIDNAAKLFNKAYEATIAASGGKPVWVTETGWPYKGPDWDEAVPSVKNAQKYWRDVGCKYLFNKTPTFWYTLRDSNPDNKMKFAITDNLSTTPLFDLSCDKVDDEETTSSAVHSKTKTESGASKPTHASNSTATFITSTASATSGSGDDEEATGTATATGSGSKPTSGSGSGSESGSGSGSGSGSEGSGSSSGSGSQSGSSSGSGSSSESGSAPAETPSTITNGAASLGVSTVALAFLALFAL
ncbi:hypothetical protein NW765_006037 [Fusarium oxysporum]|nr:hypothetical protein NW765_006037 [Fusarium oxysporum]